MRVAPKGHRLAASAVIRYNGVLRLYACLDMPVNGKIRRRLRVTGQVQGVGFRPFVYRLAESLALTGWVNNDARGVTVEVQGAPAAVDEFACRLSDDAPPLAEVASVEQAPAEAVEGDSGFRIAPSAGGELADAQVTVDSATCDDCLREMRDPADPRHRYPFINCTNCGPRYSIVTRIPYDRPNTTMSEFAMCSLCGRQYHDPRDRRFHAQPVACPACGPAVWLVDTRGRQVLCDDAIAEAARLLEQGRIVAVKGLGGFHLACRADDAHAVRRLRRRKRRDAKPFALMAVDLAAVRTLVETNPAAERLLTGPLRPVVILPRREGAPVADEVAHGLDTLGVMLPYTPLHHLLLAEVPHPLVMTSGNVSEEPLVKDNEAAVAHLGRIADAILTHNRRIARRIDDSVVQLHADGCTSVLRRARGYAPRPVRLDVLAGADAPAVLAVGAELKNTVCLLRDGRAVLSEHVGDLSDGRTYRHFIDTINHLERLFDVRPELIAADLHPSYLSTEYAMRRHRGRLAGREALPMTRVQHHHAHVASCLAEHGRAGPTIGLACDGVGYGEDGAVWGCEVLLADLGDYRRLGHLRYLPLIGGDAAAVETWRPALAALYDAFGPAELEPLAADLLELDARTVEAAVEMLETDTNCPPAGSLGRWFDAAAALARVCGRNRTEGEAPMRLEAVAARGVDERYAFELVEGGPARPMEIDLRAMVRGIVGDRAEGIAPAIVAAKFHNTVAAFLAAAAERAREQTGVATAALSGGCFANRYLTAALTRRLETAGFEVLRHERIPPGDGGVALGQAVVAAARRCGAGRDGLAVLDQFTETDDVPGDSGED
jgi:hydrogenase maturation protein HypF